MVGSVCFWVVGGVCVIRLLSVSPAHQNREYGKALMQETERLAAGAHNLYACTILRTSRNINLFLKPGYRPETLLPDHFDRTNLLCFAKYPHPDPRHSAISP